MLHAAMVRRRSVHRHLLVVLLLHRLHPVAESTGKTKAAALRRGEEFAHHSAAVRRWLHRRSTHRCPVTTYTVRRADGSCEYYLEDEELTNALPFGAGAARRHEMD